MKDDNELFIECAVLNSDESGGDPPKREELHPYPQAPKGLVMSDAVVYRPNVYIANKARVKLAKAPSEDVGVIVWAVRWDGQIIGNVVRTGEYGRDTYPWGWYITDPERALSAPKATGTSDTRRDAIAYLVSNATGETVWY